MGIKCSAAGTPGAIFRSACNNLGHGDIELLERLGCESVMERVAITTVPLSEDSRYRLLVEALTDYAVYMLNAEGVIATWNPGAERIKGYTAAEIIGQHFSRFYTDEDQRSAAPARALKIADSQGEYKTEGWRVRKNGTRFWAYVVVHPSERPMEQSSDMPRSPVI